jgi:hypothetical protein
VSLVVLLFLAVVWAVFLVPQVLRARAEKGPADSVGAFRNQLSVLERATPGMPGRRSLRADVSVPTMSMPGPVGAYRPRMTSQKELVRRRRANILLGLLGTAGVTLLLGVLLGGTMLVLHLAVDVLLVGYCALLVRARNVAAEREMKVRYLPGPMTASQAEPAVLLRRSGS